MIEPDAEWLGTINPANVPTASLVPHGSQHLDRRAVIAPAVPLTYTVDGTEYFTIDAETMAIGGSDKVEAKIENGAWTELPYAPHPVDGKWGWQVGVRARDGQDGRANLIVRSTPVNGLEQIIVAADLILKRSGALEYADRYVNANASPGGNALTAGTAAQTLQAAINTFSLTDLNTRICRLFVAAGTYDWTVLQWGAGNAFAFPVQIRGQAFVGDVKNPATVVPTKIHAGFITDSRFRHNLGSQPVFYENIEFDFGNAVRFPNGGNMRRCRLRQSLIGPAMPLHRPEYDGGHTRPTWEPDEIPAQTPNFGAQPVSGVWTTTGARWCVWESDVELVAFDMVSRRWLNKEVCQMDMLVFQNNSDNCIMDCTQTQVRNYEGRLHPAIEAEIESVAPDGSGNTVVILKRSSLIYATSETKPIHLAHTAGSTTISVTNNPQPIVSFVASSDAERRAWNTITVWVNGVPEERVITGVTAIGGQGNATLTINSPFSDGFSGAVQYEATMLQAGEQGQSYFRVFDPAVPVGNVPFQQMPDGTRQQAWYGYRIVSKTVSQRRFVLAANPATVPLAADMLVQGYTIGHGDGGGGQIFPASNLHSSPPLRVGIIRRTSALSHSWQNQLPQPGWHPVLASPDANGRITGSSATLTKPLPAGFSAYGIVASHVSGSTTVEITNSNPSGQIINFRRDDYIVVTLGGNDYHRRIVSIQSQNQITINEPFPSGFTNQNFALSCAATDQIVADSILDKAGQDFEHAQLSASLYNFGWLRVTQPCANGVDVGVRPVGANVYGAFDMWIRDCIVSGWTHDRADPNDWPEEIKFFNTYFMLATHFKTPDFMKPSGINPFIEGGTTQTVRGQNTQAGAAGYLPYPGIIPAVLTRPDGVDINGNSRVGTTLRGAKIAP